MAPEADGRTGDGIADRDVSKAYPDGVRALKDVTLTIQEVENWGRLTETMARVLSAEPQEG